MPTPDDCVAEGWGFGMGWWLGGSHMKPNPQFMVVEVRVGVLHFVQSGQAGCSWLMTRLLLLTLQKKSAAG